MIVWENIFKLFLSAFLAALIGLDREKRNKAAGIRTNIIVAVTSCLIMLLSMKVGKNTGADPGRIAAQVVSGIGFLGAGTIIKQEDKIEGLTTAAGLWGVSGLGMAIGYGVYDVAVVAALIIVFSLFISIGKFTNKDETETEIENL